MFCEVLFGDSFTEDVLSSFMAQPTKTNDSSTATQILMILMPITNVRTTRVQLCRPEKFCRIDKVADVLQRQSSFAISSASQDFAHRRKAGTVGRGNTVAGPNSPATRTGGPGFIEPPAPGISAKSRKNRLVDAENVAIALAVAICVTISR